MKDIMVDIESLGTDPESAIVSIGAVVFDMEKAVVYNDLSFYGVVDISQNIGTRSESTMFWWLQQSAAAQSVFHDPSKMSLKTVLTNFAHWIRDVPPGQEEPVVWANGDKFDIVCIEDKLRRSGINIPWKYNASRCTRPVIDLVWRLHGVNLKDEVKIDPNAQHNALEDAKWQARYMIEAYQTLLKHKVHDHYRVEHARVGDLSKTTILGCGSRYQIQNDIDEAKDDPTGFHLTDSQWEELDK